MEDFGLAFRSKITLCEVFGSRIYFRWIRCFCLTSVLLRISSSLLLDKNDRNQVIQM